MRDPNLTTATADMPAPTRIGSGDWLGRIVCGDNTEVLSGFPDACIDLVVTSPPYDDLRTYGGHSWNFEALAAQLVRVLKPGGVIVWVVGDKTENGSETLTSMRQAIHFKDVCGLNIHDTMIYRKLNYTPLTHNRYEQEWEYCFVMSLGKPKTFNPIKIPCVNAGQKTWGAPAYYKTNDGILTQKGKQIIADSKIRGNIFEYETGSRFTGEIEHPAMFPESLAKDHVASWSNPGDVVLDPFSGSGTTCKCAKELNRNFVGIEVEPKYCAIAEARLSQDVLQLETCAMRPNEKS